MAILLFDFCWVDGVPAQIIPINELLAGSVLSFIRHP